MAPLESPFVPNREPIVFHATRIDEVEQLFALYSMFFKQTRGIADIEMKQTQKGEVMMIEENNKENCDINIRNTYF